MQLLHTEKEKSDIQSHPNLDIYVVDLTNENESHDFVQKSIQKYGNIDAALLLVGGFAMGALADTTGEDLQKQIALNFETAYFVTRPLFRAPDEEQKRNDCFYRCATRVKC